MRYMVFLLNLFFVTISFADLPSEYIEVTGGKVAAKPVVVKKFSSNVDVKPLSGLIAKNLQFGGQFKVIPDFEDTESNDFAKWKSLQVEYLIAGKVFCDSGTNCKVEVYLYDVFSGRKSLELGFEEQRLEDLEPLSYHISDKIFEKITNLKGCCSSRLAYVESDEKGYLLKVADYDGSNGKVALHSKKPIMSPSWSNDNNKIAYVTYDKKHNNLIKILNLTDLSEHTVSSFPGINSAPAWSSDDTKLALVLSKDGQPKIYIKNLSDGSLQKITFGPGIDTEPVWSQDNKEIYFTSTRGGKPQVYKINLVSKKITRVTYHGSYNVAPLLAGKKLVTLQREIGGMFGIVAHNLDGSNARTIVSGEKVQSFALASNGATIIYLSNLGGINLLKTISLDGRYRQTLGVFGMISEPVWSAN